jgi:hypothetical protein
LESKPKEAKKESPIAKTVRWILSALGVLVVVALFYAFLSHKG